MAMRRLSVTDDNDDERRRSKWAGILYKGKEGRWCTCDVDGCSMAVEGCPATSSTPHWRGERWMCAVCAEEGA